MDDNALKIQILTLVMTNTTFNSPEDVVKTAAVLYKFVKGA